jgi:tRNA U34 5-carboxymethylaminomethyl modifying enzyme MnmG/GidA
MELEVALKEVKRLPNFLKKHRHRIYLHQEGSNRNSLCNGRSTKIQRNILETVGNLNGVKPN